MAYQESRGSMRAEARAGLRRRLLDGRLEPGTRLVERELAEELGMSRVPVREAIHDLAAEGFLDLQPRRGAVVRVLDERDVQELLEVREALESLAARLAARRVAAGGSAGALAALAECTRAEAQAVAAGEVESARDEGVRWHELLVRLAGSAALAEVLEPLSGRMRWLLRQNDASGTVHDEHEALLDAVARGDERAAARLAVAHVRTSGRLATAHRHRR